MKLLEVQVKYGINVVNPEDEISDFDLEKSISIQKKLDVAVKLLESLQMNIPDCIAHFTRGYDVVETDKLEEMAKNSKALKAKCEEY